MKAAILARTAFSSAGFTSAAISAAFGQQVANVEDKNLESVVVTDTRLNLNLLPEKILDTPATVNVVPASVIKAQGVSTLQDALKNVPGITLNAGEGGTHGDLVNLRGFSAGDDYFLDGLRDTGLYNRDVFDYESLEVLKGPVSTLFGRGTTGGVINQVSKTPGLYPINDITLSGGTNGEVRGTADVNYVLSDTSAVRLNLMGQRNNVVGRNFARTQKWGAARPSPPASARTCPSPCNICMNRKTAFPTMASLSCSGRRRRSITAPLTACPLTTASRPIPKW